MWTKGTLQGLIKERMKDYLFVIVSNREPYIHKYEGDEIVCTLPASGMAIALDPIMKVCSGIWVAHGSGDADRETVDSQNHIMVPPEAPSYTLRRVWLTKEEEDSYYYGFSNEALWPLCHIAFTRPQFNIEDWNTYKNVNQRFADAVLEEIGNRKAIIFIQDYHFTMLPLFIKQRNQNCITAQFWHIPWPNREAFRICPWGSEILDGLLSNDLLGFHIRHHCMNFLDAVDTAIEARVDHERFEITKSGKTTLIRPFPISIDFESINADTQDKDIDEKIKKFKKTFGVRKQKVGLGVDRIDYTKGIPERLKAIDRFFKRYPEYVGKVTFVQIGVLSRIHIQRYKELNDEINAIVEDINFRYQQGGWQPIHFLRGQYSKKDLLALYHLADFCIVSSLHDGMNLVAKEYAASSFDENGVLILSRFTGSAREFTDALLINPYAIDEMADAIKKAVEMPQDEKKKRMGKLRGIIKQNNIYRWAGKILSEILKFEFPEV